MTDIHPVLRGVILDVKDMDSQCQFYEDLFGPLKFRDGERWSELETDGTKVCFAGRGEQTGHSVALSVKVRNVEQAIAVAVTAGGRPFSQPVRGVHEIRASVLDPAGHLITFYSSISA